MNSKLFIFLGIMIIFFSLCTSNNPATESTTTTQQSSESIPTTTTTIATTTTAAPTTTTLAQVPLTDMQIEACISGGKIDDCKTKLDDLGIVKPEDCCEYLNICC